MVSSKRDWSFMQPLNLLRGVRERLNFHNESLIPHSTATAVQQRPPVSISVIVPNYNYGRYLDERLDSVLGQTLPISQLIFLDDASTDDSLDIVRSKLGTTGSDIEIIQNRTNSGSVFKQWYKGVLRASGDYVWIAEADDAADPRLLEQVVGRMQACSAAIGFCDSWQIDSAGRVLNKTYSKHLSDVGGSLFKRDFEMKGEDFVVRILAVKNAILNASAVVFRREALLEAMTSLKDELPTYKVAGDWRVYLEICGAGGRVVYLTKAYNRRRSHADSVSHVLNADRHLKEIRRIHRLAAEKFTLSAKVLSAQSKHLDKVRSYLERS